MSNITHVYITKDVAWKKLKEGDICELLSIDNPFIPTYQILTSDMRTIWVHPSEFGFLKTVNEE